MAFKSTFFGFKFTVYDRRSLFFVYTSVFAIWAAFTAFQELIYCHIWWVSVAESLDEQPPEGLCGCVKYLECSIDIVGWFTQVLEEI